MLKTLGRKVVIRPDEKEEVTTSGIIKVQVRTEHEARGVIISTGERVEEVKEGMHVIYSPFLFDEVKVDGETFHVVDEKEIFAVID